MATAAKHASPGTYSGATSEGGAFSFKIVTHGAAIKDFATTLGNNHKCSGPRGQGGAAFSAKAARMAIGNGGKFSKRITLRNLGINNKIHSPGRITGKVSGNTVSGKIVQLFNGKPNKCYTETFTAHRRWRGQHREQAVPRRLTMPDLLVALKRVFLVCSRIILASSAACQLGLGTFQLPAAGASGESPASNRVSAGRTQLREAFMAFMLGRFEVGDYDAWKQMPAELVAAGLRPAHRDSSASSA